MTESSFRQLLLRLAYIPILSLLGFLAILGVELREIALLRLAGSQATTVLLQSGRLEKSMIDEETGIRGYLAAKNPLFLQPYNEASARFDGELSLLQSTAFSDSALTAKIDAISASYKHFSDVNQILLRSTLSNETKVDLLRQQKQAMDILRAELAELTSEQSNIRESTRIRLTRILGRLPAIGIGGGAFITALLLWYGNTLFGEITSAFRQQLYETELRRDYLETTLQSIGDAVIVCNSSGKVTLMNPTAVEVTGWTSEQAKGQPLESVFRIINERTRETVESPVAKVLRFGNVVGLANHTLLVRRDGTEFPIDDSGAPIRDKNGEIVGIVLVFRDITERKQNEEALRQSNASRLRLAAIIDSADDAIVSKDLNGIVSSWNEGASRMFGYSADEMLGQPILRLIPEELHYEEDEILQKIRAGEPTNHYETRRTKKNGDSVEVSVTIFLARQDSGPEGKVYGYLLTAESELERVSHIARQTLGFYRDTGSPTEVYLHQLMENVLSVYSSKLLAAGISTDKQFHDQRKVLVSKGEILQIFSNIITNAADAMRQGGVLSISTRQIVSSTGDGIQTIIRDNGNGIRKEHLEQVFEPFFTTKGDLGTGIGLWVTKRLVEARGGEISVASNTEDGDRGTTFTIFIPFAAPTRQ
jgi:PAS domain S-box-containing protein